jgi:molecular chaperone GrpE (heat shock protein)
MSKMTDKEIIQALECCNKSGWLNDCDGCPCYDEKEDIQTSECQERIMKNALDLINRQQAEIEEYRRNIKQLTETLTGGNGLRIRVDNMIVYADDLEEWLEFCDKQKAETTKELEAKIHEKLHEAEMHGNFEPVVTREMFDSVVKELVGEGNG